jgi:hypothetical protein
MRERTETSDKELIALIEVSRIFKKLPRDETRRILLYILRKEQYLLQYEKDAVWFNLKS